MSKPINTTTLNKFMLISLLIFSPISLACTNNIIFINKSGHKVGPFNLNITSFSGSSNQKKTLRSIQKNITIKKNQRVTLSVPDNLCPPQPPSYFNPMNIQIVHIHYPKKTYYIPYNKEQPSYRNTFATTPANENSGKIILTITNDCDKSLKKTYDGNYPCATVKGETM